MITERDHEIAKNMMKYGGSFVFRLGDAAMHADSDNLERLKRAFPEYWHEYTSEALRINHPAKELKDKHGKIDRSS